MCAEAIKEKSLLLLINKLKYKKELKRQNYKIIKFLTLDCKKYLQVIVKL